MATASLGGIVGQAEHDQVGLLHHGAPGAFVLALVGGDARHRHAVHVGETPADLEAGGAGLAVDENDGLGLRWRSWRVSGRSWWPWGRFLKWKA